MPIHCNAAPLAIGMSAVVAHDQSPMAISNKPYHFAGLRSARFEIHHAPMAIPAMKAATTARSAGISWPSPTAKERVQIIW
jgi:hypothetical protein